MSQPPAIRMLQISDCHIVSDPDAEFYGRNPTSTLAQVVRHIENNEPNIDVILTTGDISHDASPESYALLAEQFGLLNTPVYSLPGNHDSHRLFHDMLNNDLLSTAGHFQIQNWLVVMLDSVIVGGEGGRVSEHELQRLEDLLTKYPDKYTLLAVHHPPVAVTCKWIDTMQIKNSDALFNTLDNHPQVRGIVCGHIHQDFQVRVNNIEIFSCPSTCHQFMPASDEYTIDPITPGYRWLRLSDSGRITSGVTRVGRDD